MKQYGGTLSTSSQKLAKLRYSDKFRPYQRAAIQMARRYREGFDKNGAAGAALVCHPTGTGKTAVIAGLAQGSPEIGNVLILTNREAVRDQLARELSGNLFMQKFKLGQRIELPKSTYVVTESRLLEETARRLHNATQRIFVDELKDFAETQFARIVQDPTAPFIDELAKNRSVLVMTVQMLVGLDKAEEAYKTLARNIDLVLFDEGHYEPAAKYSEAVRGLKRPVVLLSATPFRNDLKPFQISAENIHIYKFAQAVTDGYVREVNVVPRPPHLEEGSFCRDVIKYCKDQFGSERAKWPRVIVHCDDRASIVRLGEAFVAEGFADDVVGIHDRFFSSDDDHQSWQHRSVPPPATTDKLIWIHQYKLMEGIDDHRFRLLAFFDPLKNVRSVVQQIGRVIRVGPSDDKALKAIVLDHFKGRIAQYWALYRAYDASTSPEYLTKTMSRFYLDKFAEAHPEIDYIDRKFRERLDLRKIKAPADEILFDRRVTLKQIDPSANLDTFAEMLEEALTIDDQEFKRYAFGERVALYVCAKVTSPDFLNTLFFAEARHSARMLMLLPKYNLLAIATTGSSGGIEGLNHLDPVHPSKLERLLMPGAIGRVTAISSQNTNLGSRVVRRRTISAPSIALIPPILDEHGHVVSMVTGYNGTVPRVVDEIDYQEAIDADMNVVASAPKAAIVRTGAISNDIIRRYIGVASGRVSEHGTQLRLNAFETWVKSLAEQMTTGKRYADVYDRFATLSSETVSNGAAKNLLLDLSDFEDRYRTQHGEPLRGDDLCVDRVGPVTGNVDKPTAAFNVTLNDVTYPIDVVFNSASQRYRLESNALDNAYIGNSQGALPLGRALNETQAFNVIPEDLNVIYVHGRFYAPGLKFGHRFRDQSFFVGHCLYPSTTFKSIASEKGFKVANGGNDFDPDSLFALIDGWKTGFDTAGLSLSPEWINQFAPEAVAFKPTLCICDDTSKESADFIFADTANRRVVLIHAKASSSFREFSASAVQEVCAQAQKNTALFSTYSLRKPGNFSLWHRPHKFRGDNKTNLEVNYRIRLPVGRKPTDAWRSLSDLLHNPLTNREIWLVLGNMLSATSFHQNLRKTEPKPETLQLNHLLQTTIAAASSVGAKTRIFCAP